MSNNTTNSWNECVIVPIKCILFHSWGHKEPPAQKLCRPCSSYHPQSKMGTKTTHNVGIHGGTMGCHFMLVRPFIPATLGSCEGSCRDPRGAARRPLELCGRQSGIMGQDIWIRKGIWISWLRSSYQAIGYIHGWASTHSWLFCSVFLTCSNSL